jgi:hypothetical protein
MLFQWRSVSIFGRVPESRACAQDVVTLQEWNEQPPPEEFLIVQ